MIASVEPTFVTNVGFDVPIANDCLPVLPVEIVIAEVIAEPFT